MPTLTTAEAASYLGYTRQAVALLCKRGALAAEKRGRDWFIDEAEVERYKQAPKNRGGRSKKRSTDMFYAIAHHGTAGLGNSFGHAWIEEADERPRSDMTTTVSGPYETRKDAERAAAEMSAACDAFREQQDAE